MVTDVAGIHRVSPTDLVDLEAERRGNPLALWRARRPTTVGDRRGALDVHPGAGRQFLDRQPALFQQMLDGSHARKTNDGRTFKARSLYQRPIDDYTGTAQ